MQYIHESQHVSLNLLDSSPDCFDMILGCLHYHWLENVEGSLIVGLHYGALSVVRHITTKLTCLRSVANLAQVQRQGWDFQLFVPRGEEQKRGAS